MAYQLKYFAEIQNFRKQLARVEIYERGTTSYIPLEMADVCGLVLEVQGNQGDIFEPIVKTQLRLTFIDSTDKPTSGGKKYTGWQEFYTPDDTLYLVKLYTKATPSTSSWTHRWSGYITPDSWNESLDYHGAITITARDNIGHLQDFEFDAQANDDGLVSIDTLVRGALNLVNMPMTVSVNEPTAIVGENRELYYDGYVSVSNFTGRSWYEALESVLDGIGYCLRWTDMNRVTIAPIRDLPLLGYSTIQGQPQMADLEFYNGEGDQVPAVKRIVDEHVYARNDGYSIPILDENMGFSASETYRCAAPVNGVHFPPYEAFPEHDAPMYEVNDAGKTKWVEGTKLLNSSIFQTLADISSHFAFLPAGCASSSDKPQQALEFPSSTAAMTLKAIFKNRPYCIFGTQNYMFAEPELILSSITYAISFKVGNDTKYWDGSNWRDAVVPITQEFTEDDTELEVSTQPCEELTGAGIFRFVFTDIQYKSVNIGSWAMRTGIYFPLYNFLVSANEAPIAKNTVTTINDEAYNILINRQPEISPLSRVVALIFPDNYPSAIYCYHDGQVGAYPYMVNWDNVTGNNKKPLPVLIHQQILCYRGASLWQFSGECAPENNGLFRFDTQAHYKNRTLILQAGTMDFMRGTLTGAIFREFLDYDEIWDDTDPGDWSDNTVYEGEGSSGSWSGGGTGGSGGSGSGGATNLASLRDVSLTCLADGDILQYNATAQKWVNVVPATKFVTIEGSQEIYGAKTFTAATTAFKQISVDRRIYFHDDSHYIELDNDGYFHFSHAIWSDGFISNGGISTSGGGGGGASVLDDLDDVTISSPSATQILQYRDGQWRNTSLSTALSAYATQEWVGQQGFLTSSSLTGYATKQWVALQGYLTSSDLIGYATQTWVNNQGFITSSALSDDYVTRATTQTISGMKTFTNYAYFSDMFFNRTISGSSVSVARIKSEGADWFAWYIYPYGDTTGYTRFNFLGCVPASSGQSAIQGGLWLDWPSGAAAPWLGTSSSRWGQIFGEVGNYSNYLIVGSGTSAGSTRRIYFGGTTSADKYIELDDDGYFHINGSLYADGFLSNGGFNAATSEFVLTSGAQEISGTKTFTGGIVADCNLTINDSKTVLSKSPIRIGPSATSYVQLSFSTGNLLVGSELIIRYGGSNVSVGSKLSNLDQRVTALENR